MSGKRLLCTVAVAALLQASEAVAFAVRDDVVEAAGGIVDYYDSGGRYPNVGSLRWRSDQAENCTATLIDRRTMLTASHCFGSQNAADAVAPQQEVNFSAGNDPSGGIPYGSVLLHPGYDPDGGTATDDIAIVALARPVTGLQPVALSAQLPAASGQPVVMVGYGRAVVADLGYDPATGNFDGILVNDGRRRFVTNTLDFVGLPADLPADGYAGTSILLAADVDIPQSEIDRLGMAAEFAPQDFNSMGSAAASASEGGGLPGDSGGVLFLVMPDGSLVQAGVTKSILLAQGTDVIYIPDPFTIGYGGLTTWTAIAPYLSWIEANGFLHEATALAGDGNWSAAAHWSGGAVPDNATGYVDGGAARYYDVSLTRSGTTTLDMNPTVDTLMVDGAGALLDIAPGHILTAEVGASLAAGAIAVDGGLVAPWVRVSGGTLAGSGTLTAPQGLTQTGGTISPGGSGSIGTLTVAGPFQQSGGLLLAELSADASDRLSATGAVALAGGLQVALLGTAPPPDGAVFVLASGSSMEAATLPAPDAIGAVSFSLAAVDGDLRLLVGRRALTGLAGDDAGRAVAGALDSMRGQPGYAALFDSLDVLPSFQMAQALDQLGAVPTTAGAVSRAVSSSFLGAASDRLAAVRSGAGPTAGNNAAALRLLLTPEPEAAALLAAEDAPAGAQVARPRLSGPSDGLGSSRTTGPVLALGATGTSGAAAQAMPWGAWVQPFGLRAERRGDGAGNRWDSTIGGVTGGIDYRLRGDGAAEGLLLGASLGYARGDTGYRERGGETRLRTWQAGLYGGWWRGPWSLDAGIGAAVNSYRSRRDLNFGTTRATAEGDYRGRQLSGHLDARHQQRFAVGGPGMLEVGPMAGLQALRLETDSYDETGAGAMNLSVAADTVTSLRSSLGGAVAYPMTLPDGTWLRPELRLRWAHEFADTATVVDAAFAGPGGAAFEVRSDDLDRDSALLGAGLEARLKGGLSLSGAYDLQLQQGYSVQALTARMRLAF